MLTVLAATSMFVVGAMYIVIIVGLLALIKTDPQKWYELQHQDWTKVDTFFFILCPIIFITSGIYLFGFW